jgi:hypothetical protein
MNVTTTSFVLFSLDGIQPWQMERYRSLSGKAGISAFEIGIDHPLHYLIYHKITKLHLFFPAK